MKATRDLQERPAQEMPPEYSWTTAAESLGIRSKSKISGSVNHGTTHRGLRWRWVETEE